MMWINLEAKLSQIKPRSAWKGAWKVKLLNNPEVKLLISPLNHYTKLRHIYIVQESVKLVTDIDWMTVFLTEGNGETYFTVIFIDSWVLFTGMCYARSPLVYLEN